MGPTPVARRPPRLAGWGGEHSRRPGGSTSRAAADGTHRPLTRAQVHLSRARQRHNGAAVSSRSFACRSRRPRIGSRRPTPCLGSTGFERHRMGGRRLPAPGHVHDEHDGTRALGRVDGHQFLRPRVRCRVDSSPTANDPGATKRQRRSRVRSFSQRPASSGSRGPCPGAYPRRSLRTPLAQHYVESSAGGTNPRADPPRGGRPRAKDAAGRIGQLAARGSVVSGPAPFPARVPSLVRERQNAAKPGAARRFARVASPHCRPRVLDLVVEEPQPCTRRTSGQALRAHPRTRMGFAGPNRWRHVGRMAARALLPVRDEPEWPGAVHLRCRGRGARFGVVPASDPIQDLRAAAAVPQGTVRPAVNTHHALGRLPMSAQTFTKGHSASKSGSSG